MERYLIPSILEQTRLEFAAFGNYAGMMGACSAAMQKQNPLWEEKRMRKVLYVPLDDRDCNYQFPWLLSQMTEGLELYDHPMNGWDF
ncbi:MAG: hypothetical protein ACLURV_09815 [Gallintestinimicrobium sp.]